MKKFCFVLFLLVVYCLSSIQASAADPTSCNRLLDLDLRNRWESKSVNAEYKLAELASAEHMCSRDYSQMSKEEQLAASMEIESVFVDVRGGVSTHKALSEAEYKQYCRDINEEHRKVSHSHKKQMEQADKVASEAMVAWVQCLQLLKDGISLSFKSYGPEHIALQIDVPRGTSVWLEGVSTTGIGVVCWHNGQVVKSTSRIRIEAQSWVLNCHRKPTVHEDDQGKRAIYDTSSIVASFTNHGASGLFLSKQIQTTLPPTKTLEAMVANLRDLENRVTDMTEIIKKLAAKNSKTYEVPADTGRLADCLKYYGHPANCHPGHGNRIIMTICPRRWCTETHPTKGYEGGVLHECGEGNTAHITCF